MHKGLLSNLVFVAVMVVGVALIEQYYPVEGPRGLREAFSNASKDANKDAECVRDATCVVYRIVRSVGVFGFFGEYIHVPLCG